MGSTATSISRRMQATYESDLEDALVEHMRASVRVSIPKKEEREPAAYKLTFSTAAAYEHARRTIAVAGLATRVSFPGGRAIQYPQRLEIGEDDKANLGEKVLGLPKEAFKR